MGVAPEHALGIADIEIGGVLFFADVVTLGRLVAVTSVTFLGVNAGRDEKGRCDDSSDD
ncbi:MAG: hypothetical protein P8Y27_05345 [Chromatiaceae bacterium]